MAVMALMAMTRVVAMVPRDGADEEPHDNEDDEEHDGNECRHVLLACLRELVVHHGHAGEVEIDIGIFRPDILRHGTDKTSNFGDLVKPLAGEVNRDVYTGHVSGGGDEAVYEERFIEGDCLDSGEFIIHEG